MKKSVNKFLQASDLTPLLLRIGTLESEAGLAPTFEDPAAINTVQVRLYRLEERFAALERRLSAEESK